MALQIRRGLEADRLTITPSTGELIYTTDSKLVYVGDGATAGGTLVTGGAGLSFNTIAVPGQPLVVADSSSDILNLVAGSGVSITTNSGSDTITIAAPNDVVLDTTPQLGGDLDVNGYRIISSASNSNITISPNGTGRIFVTSGITRTLGNINIAPIQGITVIGDQPNGLDGNLYIIRETFNSSNSAGLVFAQHHDTAEAVALSFYRSRGSATNQTAVLTNDRLGTILFKGSDGAQQLIGAAIQSRSVANSSTNFLRANLRFSTTNGSSATTHVELTYDGILKVKQLQAYTGNDIILSTNNSLTVGDVRLNQNGLSTANSNADLTLSANGTGLVNINSPVRVLGSNLKLSGIPTATRDLLSASNGMLIYNSDLNKFQGYENGAWVNLI